MGSSKSDARTAMRFHTKGNYEDSAKVFLDGGFR
jgi:hypothetical protein